MAIQLTNCKLHKRFPTAALLHRPIGALQYIDIDHGVNKIEHMFLNLIFKRKYIAGPVR